MGTGAELGPGVMLLDRTRLPGKAMPATVDAGLYVPVPPPSPVIDEGDCKND